MALKTYLGEFCAHKDEKTQSQELVRRLHLCPPVCGSASHMQIPRTPLSLSQGLSGRYGLSGARFRLLLLCWIPSKTQQYRSQYLFRKIVSVHIYFDLGVEVSARSSSPPSAHSARRRGGLLWTLTNHEHAGPAQRCYHSLG